MTPIYSGISFFLCLEVSVPGIYGSGEQSPDLFNSILQRILSNMAIRFRLVCEWKLIVRSPPVLVLIAWWALNSWSRQIKRCNKVAKGLAVSQTHLEYSPFWSDCTSDVLKKLIEFNSCQENWKNLRWVLKEYWVSSQQNVEPYGEALGVIQLWRRLHFHLLCLEYL